MLKKLSIGTTCVKNWRLNVISRPQFWMILRASVNPRRGILKVLIIINITLSSSENFVLDPKTNIDTKGAHHKNAALFKFLPKQVRLHPLPPQICETVHELFHKSKLLELLKQKSKKKSKHIYKSICLGA